MKHIQVDANGLRMRVADLDTGVGRVLREHGHFAPLEQRLIAEVCRGDLLDVGANIGAVALPFARAHPGQRVVAIEAHPEIFGLLSANVAANSLSNLDAVHAAAGEASGFVELPVADLSEPGNHGASSLYKKGLPTARTRMVRLDDVAPVNCAFVKVDVEGFEDRVLQGADELLRVRRPDWLVEVSRHRPNTAALVQQALREAGYRLFWFWSPWSTPVRLGDTGDTAIFASDRAPPWPMRPVTADWPASIDDFPYLKRFLA